MSCNATTKYRGKLKICELPISHDEDHMDEAFHWKRESVREPKRIIGEHGEEKQ